MQQHNPDFWEERELDRKGQPYRKNSAGREVFAGGASGAHRASASRGERARNERVRNERTKEHQARAGRPPANADGRTRVAKQDPARRPAPGGPKRGKPGGKTTAKMVAGNLLKALLVLVCVIVIVVGIVAVQVVSYVVDATANDDQYLNLEKMALPQNGAQLARDPDTGEWVEYQKLVWRDSNSVWVDLHNIPQNLIDAVISTEDQRYYEHKGVNWFRTAQAGLNEVFGSKDTFGGSTLTQQLVKNLTGDDEVVDESGSMLGGYKRKTKEIFRAQYLDKTYGKDLVLEAYLNTLPLSGTIIGVQAGAMEYFNKDVGELTLPEAALIAGITQKPTTYNPFTNPENALGRRDQVLKNMLNNEKITKADYDAAVAEPLGIYDGPRASSATGSEGNVTSYFADAVFNEVIQDLVDAGYAKTREEAVRFYYTHGLQIETTVDLKLQWKMEEVYAQGWGAGTHFPELPVETEVTHEDGSVTTETVNPQSAMAVVRYDGSLAGVVGGLGEKTESLGLNRATQSDRQVGSTMKPLAAYALGIDYELINYSSLLPDSYVIPEQQWPKNWPGLYAPSGGSVLACDALAESLNTCAAHVGQWVGIEAMYEHMEETLEVSTLVPEGANNDKALSPLVLGGMTKGMKPAELANAYTMFGGSDSYGTFTSLHTYERVLDSDGNVLLQPDLVTMQAISPESGYIMNRMLKNVLNSPVGTANGMGLATTDSVAKTGTTSDDKDRWFVGLTPNYVSAVWWGYDTNEQIQWSAGASTNPPPNVWRTIMDSVQAEMEYKEFPGRPEGVSEQMFCRESGLLAGPGCGSTQVGYYTANNTPVVCDNHSAPPAADADAGDAGGEEDDD